MFSEAEKCLKLYLQGKKKKLTEGGIFIKLILL